MSSPRWTWRCAWQPRSTASAVSTSSGAASRVTKIDIFALGPSRYDEVEFSRRRKVKVRASGEELYVKAPEDTVLRKLLWYREGGEVSTKQWRDIVEVLRVSGPELDQQYLVMWSEKLRVDDLLTRAQAEAAGKLGPQ